MLINGYVVILFFKNKKITVYCPVNQFDTVDSAFFPERFFFLRSEQPTCPLGTDVISAWDVFYVNSVRCPKCRKSLTWYHAKHTKLTNAYVAKDTSVSCPICGYNPFAEQI